MGFEGFNSSQWHKRSKSFPDSRGAEDNNTLVRSAEDPRQLKLDLEDSNGCHRDKSSSNAEIHHSLRQEILLLEKRLHEQDSVRCALEKALGYRASSRGITAEATIPKPATELIREISVLEIEVEHLEQYLLSLYRKAFDQKITYLSPSKDEGSKSMQRRRALDFSRSDIVSTTREYVFDSQIHPNSNREVNGLSEVGRSQSSLSQRSTRVQGGSPSPPDEPSDKALRACHSQPLSMMENSSSNIISLAEHLGTRISDLIPETPNKLSEEMVKCMCNIYCKLADPPLPNNGLLSPASSVSSVSAFSPKDQRGLWSPGFRNDSSFDTRLDNPFHVEGLKDFSGPYSTMVEIHCIYRDSQKLDETKYLLQNFRSLISRLEDVDPGKMAHEEKLAFWINVHNALVMHAFLAYGIPQNSVKRMFLLLKAAYNVGGQIVSADAIQSSILHCRMSRPGQWLRLLLPWKAKFKAGDERQAFGIDHPEPLLHFALSSGSHSDPSVRIYTPKRVIQELEAAKEDYIRATFGVRKDHKILLPKIVDSFAKDSGLCQAGLLEMIQHSLPDKHRKSIRKLQGKNRKNIEWVSHNFSFRYLILKEHVK